MQGALINNWSCQCTLALSVHIGLVSACKSCQCTLILSVHIGLVSAHWSCQCTLILSVHIGLVSAHWFRQWTLALSVTFNLCWAATEMDLPLRKTLRGRSNVMDCGFNFCHLFYFIFILCTLLSSSGNSGRLTWLKLQQPQEQRYPVLVLPRAHAGSFRVYDVVHRTVTWTTGYLIFNR